MTNIEWLRSLSAEELVKVNVHSCKNCAFYYSCNYNNVDNCTEGHIKWLNQEHEEELMPCPFCGSENVYIHSKDGYADKTTVIFCNSCKSTVFIEDNEEEGYDDKTVDRAVKAWNRREGK